MVTYKHSCMSKIFYPERSEDVPASAPHPVGAAYRVSIGREAWGERHEHVVKIQMLYDGRIAGRKSPSFPVGSHDFARVQATVLRLLTS